MTKCQPEPVAARRALPHRIALPWAVLGFTDVGKAIRACADKLLGARVLGLNVAHLYGLTFGLGCACVGIAGTLLTLLVDVTPASGPAYTLLALRPQGLFARR